MLLVSFLYFTLLSSTQRAQRREAQDTANDVFTSFRGLATLDSGWRHEPHDVGPGPGGMATASVIHVSGV